MIADTDIVRQYGAQNAAKIAAALGQRAPGESRAPSGIVAAAPAVPAPDPATPAPDLELTPPPDAKAEKQRVNREAAEQIAFMDRVRECLDPATGKALPGRPGADLVFALANENAAGKGIGVLRWKMGIKAGLCDVGIFAPRRGFPGAFIEFKQDSGVPSDVKPHQRECIEALRCQGYKAVVAFGRHEAWKFLCWYLGWEQS